jgi:hypothetical protein
MKSWGAVAILVAAAFVPCPGAEPQEAARDATQDFDRSIAPLLARRCLDCHSGPKPKGKLDLSRQAGAAKVLGGRFWEQVGDDEMPPKKPLPAAEKKLLREWIARGAPWGSDPIDPFRFTTAERAGYDWWALRPLETPALPVPRRPARHPIDAFVLERLEAAKLEPSPPAERRALIRRLSFDLLGLPPTPEDVQAFVADPAEDAFERLVDRYLASPHYGERWARHWLDVVRFGESNGFERDLPRDNAWPYRDWVIQALNADLPYDEFVRFQIAGDLIKPGDPDALIATGFLVAGPHDTVVPASDRMQKAMRQDELEDVVGVAAQTFLGLTVNCARCHDHKFDPIPQADYYRFAAALAGAQHGEREIQNPETTAKIAPLRTRIDALAAEIAALERAAAPAPRGIEPPRPMASWTFGEGLRDRIGALHGTVLGSARTEAAGLILDGKTAFVETIPIDRDLGAKTLEAWVRLDNLEQRGGGVLSVQTRDGSLFDAIVFGERDPARWMAGSNFFKRTQSFNGPAETEASARPVHVAIVYRADGTIAGYRDGRPYGAPYRSEGIQPFRAGDAAVVFGVRHTPPGGNKMLAGTLARANLYDRALSDEEIAASAGLAEAVLSDADHRKRETLRAETARLRKEIAALEASGKRKLYCVSPSNPGAMRVLRRGDVSDPGDVVSPAGLGAIAGYRGDLGLAPDAPDADRRKQLALWITSKENPLFARVIVNRLWHHHFGRGLVDTPNDFGFNGGRPSHPKLLDWLASELIRREWKLKDLHRLIVTSAAWRQASAGRREALEADAGNRLLWRRSPQRLEAEAIRDAMLRVTGELDPTVGGRGYRDVLSHFFKGTQFYDPIDPEGPEAKRRTLYRFGARGGRSPFLETFDCPDPSTPSPQRAVTTTPIQALALLNNSFVLRMSDKLAERIRRDAGAEAAAQADRAIALCFGRAMEEKECDRYARFIADHGLPAFCRVIFNSSEFLYVD